MSASTRVVISMDALPGDVPAFVTRAGDLTLFVWSWEALRNAVTSGTPGQVERFANSLLSPMDSDGGNRKRGRWLTSVAAAAVTVGAAAAQLSSQLPSLPSS